MLKSIVSIFVIHIGLALPYGKGQLIWQCVGNGGSGPWTQI